jgi:uncharacterized protein YggE
MRVIVVLALALAALAATGCGGDEGSSGQSGTADRSAFTGQPTGGAAVFSPEGITVVGTGSAKAAPDKAGWSFGVRTDADTAEAAMRQNAQKARRVIDALKGGGVDGDDLRTEAVSLYPRTDEMGTGIIGYTASNSIHATVSLDRVGRLVDTAVAAGANEVSGPNLTVSDTDEQYRDAVAKALDDARAKAEALANSAGLTLGDPIVIVEGGGGPGPVFNGRALADTAADVPIEPGKQEVQAILTVTFAIG